MANTMSYSPLAAGEDDEMDVALFGSSSDDMHEFDGLNPFTVGSAASIKNLINGSIDRDNSRRLSGSIQDGGGGSVGEQALSASMVKMTTEPTEGAAAATTKASWAMDFCHTCAGITPQDPASERKAKAARCVVEVSCGVTCCYWFERIIHNKFCNFLFKCNCTWTWAGGWNDCNVHNTSGLPKCPWCTARSNVSWTTDSLLFVLMTLTFLVCLYFRPPPASRLDKVANVTLRWAAPVIVYFLAGTFVGWLFKVTGSYPTFIV